MDGERRSGPNVSKPETLDLSAAGLASPASALLVFPESIAPRLPEDIADLPSEWATPRAEGLVACADLSAEPEPLVPLYLRRPDAVEPKAKPRSAALVGGNEETPAS